MIAKITRGSRPRDIGAYLHGPGREGEHYWMRGQERHEGGIVIGGNLFREGETSERFWAKDLRLGASARPDAKRPIWHMSLRCAPEDRTLSNAEWRSAIQEMGERMGWAQHPHVIVRHADDHVHVVVSRVNHDGAIWVGKNDARAAQQARQHVEKRLGLREVPTIAKDTATRRDNKVKQGEYRKGVASGKAPERVELAYRVEAAVTATEGLGREAFEAALTKTGVEYEANVASTGRVSGYRFHLPEHVDAKGEPVWWKASQLDRELSWNKISPRIGTAPVPEPEPIKPKGLLESRGSYQAREEQAQREAVQRQAAHVKKRVESTNTTGTPPAVRAIWKARRQKVEEKAHLRHVVQLHRASFPTKMPARTAQLALENDGKPMSAQERLRRQVEARAARNRADAERARRDYTQRQPPGHGLSR